MATGLNMAVQCEYRQHVRRDETAGEVAQCQLLAEITGLRDARRVTVGEAVCQRCSGQSTPSARTLNPTVASLLHRLTDEIVAEGGAPGCDHGNAERLNTWAFDCLPIVPSKSNPLGPWRGVHPSICEQHADGQPETVSCIQLTRSLGHVIGQGFHRSGWPYAMRSLQPLFCRNGILFDDFIEQGFCYTTPHQVHSRPWVGVFHHPGVVPEFVEDAYALESIFTSWAWQESVGQMQGAIALSETLADYLRDRLDVPVAAIKHPTEVPDRLWSEAEYLNNPRQKLVQLGWYLRNTRAIHQVPRLERHDKVRCLPAQPHILDYDAKIIAHWDALGTRQESGDVADLGYISHDEYDTMLTSNVVLTELFNASANNVVVECIARNTPLIVNRESAVVEYLSPDYPLYFDDLEEVPSLLATDRIIAAHRFLKAMDKDWLSGESFCASIRQALTTMEIAQAGTRTSHVEGWYEESFSTILRGIDRQQGFGHIAEIGVHHGKSFLPLYRLCRGGEVALAVDCFGEQQFNRSESGRGNQQMFLDYLPHTNHLKLLQGDSLTFAARDYLAAAGGRFRLFHVDGGHDVESSLHDLTEAAQALTEDGVLIVDDVFNSDWPEVSEALYRFMASSELKPFMIGFGKVCLSRRSYVLASPRYVKSWLGTDVQIF